MTYTNTTFVRMLPENVQKSIRRALTAHLSNVGLSKAEIREGIENGMDSRLGDLSEAIDTRKYLDMANGKTLKGTTKGMKRYKLTYNNYYSRFQSGDLIKEIESKNDKDVINLGLKYLRDIIAKDPDELHFVPMVHISRYNERTKRFRKEFVIAYDYDHKKCVSLNYDKWAERYRRN